MNRVNFAGLGVDHTVRSVGSYTVLEQQSIATKFGNSQNLVISQAPLPSEVGVFLGETSLGKVFAVHPELAHGDELEKENATLTKSDRSMLLANLNMLNPDVPELEPNVFVPQEDGSFVAAYLHVQADQQIADFSELDFSKVQDRNYSLSVIKSKPRLIVMKLRPSNCETSDTDVHTRWATSLASKQDSHNLGFMFVQESESDSLKSPSVQNLFSIPDTKFTPVEWCKHGLIVREDQLDSGIITNIPEIRHSLERWSDSLKKKRGQNHVTFQHQDIFQDILTRLNSEGWVSRRNFGMSIESYFHNMTHTGLTTNTDRIAADLVQWLQAEQLCDLDMSSQDSMSRNYPVSIDGTSVPTVDLDSQDLQNEDTTLTVPEILVPAAGETLTRMSRLALMTTKNLLKNRNGRSLRFTVELVIHRLRILAVLLDMQESIDIWFDGLSRNCVVQCVKLGLNPLLNALEPCQGV